MTDKERIHLLESKVQYLEAILNEKLQKEMKSDKFSYSFPQFINKNL